MKTGSLILAGAALSLVLGAAAFGFSIASERPRLSGVSAPSTTKLASVKRSLDDACSSTTTYQRLKTKLFDVALDVGDVDPGKLDLLAGSTVVRMEDPILKAKDEELGVTVCSGRFVVELPPGAEKAFDGRRRLEADIEYAAQVAADGSGIVYQLRGAEPITYRLAAFDLQGLPPLAPADPVPALSHVEPILMPPEPVPAGIVAPPPEPDPKPIPAVVASAKAEPVKVEKQVAGKAKKATPGSQIGVGEAEPARAKKVHAVTKMEVAGTKVAEKAKPKPEKAKPKPEKAPAKVAATKTKAADKAATKSKTIKPPVKAVAAKPKPPEVKKPTAPVRVASTLPKPKPAPKALAKAAAAAPRPAPARAAVQQTAISSRDLPCGAGRPLSERLMCVNPALVGKERRMMGVYQSALDNADGVTRRMLQETAGDFQAYRNNCRTEACLSGAFDDRLAEIRDIMADMR